MEVDRAKGQFKPNWTENESSENVFAKKHSVYIGTVSSWRLLFTLPNQFKLVYGPFWQSNIHRTLYFCPRSTRKVTNVPLHTYLRESKSLLS
jgi:hypothetical protein